MRIVSCRVTPYAIPVRLALHIGTQPITTREGFIVKICGDNDTIGIGEVAPLPGLHAESFSDAGTQVHAVAEAIKNSELPEKEHLTAGFLSSHAQSLHPSVRNGMEMALFDSIWSGSRHDTPTGSVPLNALITQNTHDPVQQALQLVESGYSSLKLKVGRNTLEQDVLMVNRVRSAVNGRAMLRLDANRAWTLAQSIAFGNSIGPAGIEYIEEPVRDGTGIGEFCRETGLAAALDETLAAPGFVEPAIPEGVCAFILKPAMLGSITHTIHLIHMAQRHGIRAVLSSCFESSVGLKFYAQMAIQNGLTGYAHGLDTWRWLHTESEVPLSVKRGCIIC